MIRYSVDNLTELCFGINTCSCISRCRKTIQLCGYFPTAFVLFCFVFSEPAKRMRLAIRMSSLAVFFFWFVFLPKLMPCLLEDVITTYLNSGQVTIA